MLMEVYNLGSSSKGNAYFLNIKRGENDFVGVLIECGFRYDEIAKKLRFLSNGKFTMKNVDVVLITHKHDDHSLSVVDMLKMNKRVYAPKQVYDYWKIDINDYKNNAFVLKHGKRRAIANRIVVSPYAMKHDEHENFLKSQQRKGVKIELVDENPDFVENLGYVITINNNYDILFIIDTMYSSYNLSGYKFREIFIEANHFAQPTYIAYDKAQKTNDYGNIKRYRRNIYSHMNIETTIKTLNGFDLRYTNRIFITHTSSTERHLGDEIKFYKTIMLKLKPTKAQVLVCLKNGSFHTGAF